MDILNNQTLEMKNIISYRGKATAIETNEVMKRLNNFIAEKGLQKNGYITTTTFSIENVNGQQIMDIEILIPVDRKIDINTQDGFTYKSEFKLINALKIQHKGNPATMQATVDRLTAYMKENKLTPITSAYNVTVVEPKSQQDLDSMIVDIYIGITENIL